MIVWRLSYMKEYNSAREKPDNEELFYTLDRWCCILRHESLDGTEGLIRPVFVLTAIQRADMSKVAQCYTNVNLSTFTETKLLWLQANSVYFYSYNFATWVSLVWTWRVYRSGALKRINCSEEAGRENFVIKSMMTRRLQNKQMNNYR